MAAQRAQMAEQQRQFDEQMASSQKRYEEQKAMAERAPAPAPAPTADAPAAALQIAAAAPVPIRRRGGSRRSFRADIASPGGGLSLPGTAKKTP